MRKFLVAIFLMTLAATHAHTEDSQWYTGDEHCPPPKENGTYSAPYNALDHPHDYPTFFGADKPGWSCSYQNDDGTIVQYGNSQTPQQQWLAVWGNEGNDNNN